MIVSPSVTIEGDLRQIMAAELGIAETAVTRGIRAGSDGLKGELRQQVLGAGMSQRLANTWRSETYPRGGTSLRAAGLIFTRAPDLIDAFNRGVTIRSPNGFYLAIPTPAAGKFGFARQSSPESGQKLERLTPGGWERRTGMKLRFVFRPGKRVSFLVADNVRVGAGGIARANTVTRKGNKATRLTGRTTAVIFWLVPQVKLAKRLDVEGAARNWSAKLPDLIVNFWRD
ncbi:MAG: hypothetical protein K0S00_4068 [Xanthobacteraceae bacterium]|jgi:hypothetical protein|nr:hypothetical protein [Xanthobacteraceae bacterium]